MSIIWRALIAKGLALGVLIALWSPNLWDVYADTAAGQVRWQEAAGLGAIFWLLCWAVLGHLWLLLALALPVALVWPFELWLRWQHGTLISPHMVALVLESNLAESTNFFSASGHGLIALILGWALLYAIGLWLAWRWKVRWQHRSRIYFLMLFLPLLTILYQSNNVYDPLVGELKDSIIEDPKMSAWQIQWADVYPVNLPISLAVFSQQQGQLHTVQAALAARSLQAHQLPLANTPEIIILVIGESATATRWGLLGFERDTTPSLSQQQGLIAFSDVVALSSATRTAVPGVLSRKPVLAPNGNIDMNAEPSLIKAFSQVGYKTHWLSNQSPIGKNDTSISLYAREAADVQFLNPATYEHRSNLDEVLLAPLRAILAQPGRHLVVLHFLGSHFDYSLRYPASFDHFHPSLQSAPAAAPDSALYAEQLDNSYDNSLRYTDHVLAEVLDAVQQRGGQGVVAYFSDHGVDPAQGKCASKASNRRSAAAYQVPAFVWLSESMRVQQSAQWQQLQDNAHQPYTTRAVYSTLLELAHIDIAEGLPAENFLHTPSQPLPSRMVADMSQKMLDFDAARAKNACFIVKQ